jgi:hypothetical protein
MEVPNDLEQYATLLRIRKKWTLRYAIMNGVLLAICAVVAFGEAWAFRDVQVSPLSTLTTAIALIGPLFGSFGEATEYRRLKDTLELIDVLQRTTSENPPEH